MRLHGDVVVTIMSGGCVSEAKGKRERERGRGTRTKGVVRAGWVEQGRDGRRVPLCGEEEESRGGWQEGRTGRVSVGKRVASASTLFHPPTTLPLLARSKRGGGGWRVEDRGWKEGDEREEKGN